MDICLAQALQGCNIVGNVLLPLRRPHLDGVVNVHTLDSHYL